MQFCSHSTVVNVLVLKTTFESQPKYLKVNLDIERVSPSFLIYYILIDMVEYYHI